MSRIFRLGTRSSPLAMAQTNKVFQTLCEAGGWTKETAPLEIISMQSTGDTIIDRPLSMAGGKGLFTKDIERALVTNQVDIAVHSAKDLETSLPDGTCIGAVLSREDVRDVFISKTGHSFLEMPAGAKVGTASLRRAAQLRRLRSDLQITLIRGNVQTRLKKIEQGEVDASLLALAGLKRLGMDSDFPHILPTELFLPAVGQGIIALQCRVSDRATCELLGKINDRATKACLTAERAMLARLDGSCRTPIAGLCTWRKEWQKDQLHLKGQVFSYLHDHEQAPRSNALNNGIMTGISDMCAMVEVSAEADPESAQMLGENVGERLLELMGKNFFSSH